MRFFAIDVPHSDSEEAETYLTGQLWEMIRELEQVTGKKFDQDRLSETIRRENESKRLYAAFVKEANRRWYPNTLTTLMALLYPTHLSIGSEEALRLFRILKEDVEKYPPKECSPDHVGSSHPYYQKTLRHYFKPVGSELYQPIYDFGMDYMEEMDERDPVAAVARKMLRNIYNGDFRRKTEMLTSMANRYTYNGVIHYCHWGCKQASGGVMLLREAMAEKHFPMLILDGDALDRRNDQDGQIRTRLEAFLEMMKNGRRTKR